MIQWTFVLTQSRSPVGRDRPPPTPASSHQLTARIPGRFFCFFLLCLFELCGCFCVVFDSMLCACHVSDSILCFGCGLQLNLCFFCFLEQCVPVPIVLDIFRSFCVFALFCISFRCFYCFTWFYESNWLKTSTPQAESVGYQYQPPY